MPFSKSQFRTPFFWSLLILLMITNFQQGFSNYRTKTTSNDGTHQKIKNQSPLETYWELGNSFKKKNKPVKAIEAFTLGLQAAEKSKNIPEKMKFCKALGVLQLSASNYTQSLEQFQTIIEDHDNYNVDNHEMLASAYQYMATAYKAMGNYELAYEHQIQALQQNELIPDSMGIANAQYGIASIFFYQHNYEGALQYYNDALKLCTSIGNQRVVFSCLGAIGSTYNRMGKTDLAVDYNIRSLKLAQEINYDVGVCYAMQNIGSDYLKLGHVTLAIDYFNQTIDIRSKIEDKWGLCGTYRLLGEAYLANENYPKAAEYTQQSLHLAKEIKSNTRKIEAYKVLADIYKADGQSDQAFDFLSNYLILKDSSINESSIQKMTDIKKSYEIEKKEKEIALMKADQEIQQWQRNTIIAAFVIALLIMWIIYGRYQTQFANNQILEEKNKLIQEQNGQLEEANSLQIKMNEKLEVSNKELEQFAYVASHDLKEPLRTINSYVTLLQRRFLSKIEDPTANEFMTYVIDGTRRMQNLLDELLSYSQSARANVRTEVVNTSEVAELVTFNLTRLIEEKNAKVNIDQLPIIKANKSQINQLFQNLISNAVKYTREDMPEVNVRCHQKENNYVFSIQDNGIGIPEERKDDIFQMFTRLHTSREFEGTGIGLATCKKIVDQYGGNIWVESEKNEGSTFYFSIPGALKVN